MSQLTTHVLDTSCGKPAQNINVELEFESSDQWIKIAIGKTNGDGRVADLLSKDLIMQHGVYRLTFYTKTYFDQQNIKSFYPKVTIEFLVADETHYHVPLLLNPYGYSTYRGS